MRRFDLGLFPDSPRHLHRPRGGILGSPSHWLGANEKTPHRNDAESLGNGGNVLSANTCELAAAANRGAVEADEAGATVFGATGEGVAAGLEDFAAGFIAAGASDAAAILGEFAFAQAAGQLDVANGHSAHLAIDRTYATGQHPAQVLHRATGDFVRTTTVDFQAIGALFERDFAPRDHAPIDRLRGRLALGGHAGIGRTHHHATLLHHCLRHT